MNGRLAEACARSRFHALTFFLFARPPVVAIDQDGSQECDDTDAN
jgi:hypothetical protein